ncbi:MAG: hypothetical protein MJ147_01340 [Clostridia bacterium]|nr:hypothetical protein [Clostridia bacterium]
MKKLNLTGKKVFAILFSLFVFFYFATVCERFVRSSVLHIVIPGALKTETAYTGDSESTDWEAVYPFKEEDLEAEQQEKLKKKKEEPKKLTALDIYKNKADNIKSSVDYYTSKLLFLRMKFIEFNSFFNKTIGMKLFSGSDDIAALADGSLVYYTSERDISIGIKNMISLSEYVNGRGEDFLYVQVPSKIDPETNYLPAGIVDYGNETADKMLNALKKENIKYLDLRDCMKKQGMSYTESFYFTDHHWKTGVGMWAANEISKTLASFGVNYQPELLSKDNYTETVYEKYLLGSLGREVTLANADPEDISIYTPDFETDFTVDYYDFGKRTGDFKESLLNMSFLQKIDYYNTSPYSAYLYGVSPIVTIKNNMANNNKRVLFIADSFCHCVLPYVATQVQYVDKIDLRYFTGSVKTFIEKTNPDIVVVMYYPGSLVDGNYETMRLK